MWRIDSREIQSLYLEIDTDDQVKVIAIVQARDHGSFKQQDGIWQLLRVVRFMVHLKVDILNITSNRFSVSCEKENEKDSKVLGLST